MPFVPSCWSVITLLLRLFWHSSVNCWKTVRIAQQSPPYIPEKFSGFWGAAFPLAHMVLHQCWVLDAPTTRRTSQWSRSLRSCCRLKRSISCQKKGLPWSMVRHCLTGIGALATYDGIQLLKLLWSLVLSQWKFTMELPVHSKIFVHPPQSGQLATARNIVTFLKEARIPLLRLNSRSKILIRTSLSLKSHGASKDSGQLAAKEKVEIEINSVWIT